MSTPQPIPIPLGYLPRKPWVCDASFAVPGVQSIASVSACLNELVVLNPPEYGFINSGFHYPTAAAARAAARRANAQGEEIHATLLFPLVFDHGRTVLITAHLSPPANPAVPLPDTAAPSDTAFESLGLDVVALAHPSSDHTVQQPLEWIAFGCSPLSCNGLGREYAVNRRCLLDRWDDAVNAATRFAIEVPEPGPYVIVEIRRTIRELD